MAPEGTLLLLTEVEKKEGAITARVGGGGGRNSLREGVPGELLSCAGPGTRLLRRSLVVFFCCLRRRPKTPLKGCLRVGGLEEEEEGEEGEAASAGPLTPSPGWPDERCR